MQDQSLQRIIPLVNTSNTTKSPLVKKTKSLKTLNKIHNLTPLRQTMTKSLATKIELQKVEL